MELETKNATCGYNGKPVVSDINIKIKSGEILCLLGPNGSGKTTFLKTILGFLKLQSGQIILNGESIDHWTGKKMAQNIGYVPQVHTPPFPFTVLDVVTMGRAAHLGIFSSPATSDFILAESMLNTLGIGFLKDCIYTEISGGERQMVLIARALVQQPHILVLDEPTMNLDFGNQARVLKQINHLACQGIGVIMSTHFPDHAFLCPGKAALMRKNEKLIFGDAREIVTEENLRAAYGIDVKIAAVADSSGRTIKTCVPLINEAI
jgi:iron complex transport system ATP-binding protein